MTKKAVERTYSAQKCCLRRELKSRHNLQVMNANRQLGQTDSPKTLTKKNVVIPWYSNAVNIYNQKLKIDLMSK